MCFFGAPGLRLLARKAAMGPCCPGSDRYETKRLLRGKGSPKLRVANQPTSGDPYAGFWPARSDYQEREGGVAPSRREDRRYRSGEKARRRGAVAAGGERRAQR